MKVIAAVLADFEGALLGGPSRLGERLGSRPILHHTLRRAAQIAGVERRVLCVSPRDAQAAAAALRESGVEERVSLVEIDAGHRPRLELIRCARKWNLHAWRGAPLGMTYFDEFVEPIVAGRVLISCEADAVLCIDAHSPAFDAAIADPRRCAVRVHDAPRLAAAIEQLLPVRRDAEQVHARQERRTLTVLQLVAV
ncbi:MAG TPA: hypothetical protein PKC49_09000, partial [Phycisphaerae bacterium]|nr:hypothetical protein [Phycisphaerae bacterium]